MSEILTDQLAGPGPADDGTRPLAWQDDALCAEVGLDMFFPDKGGSTKDAKEVCARCDVREQCLAYALENDERFGVWGGLSERARRRLQKEMAA